MVKNYTFTIHQFWLFFFDRCVQFVQLTTVDIRINCLVPWKLLKKEHTFPIPTNRRHNLFLMQFSFRYYSWWFIHRDITDRVDNPAWNLSAWARDRVIRRVRLSLLKTVRVDKDRKNLPSSLSFALTEFPDWRCHLQSGLWLVDSICNISMGSSRLDHDCFWTTLL